MQAKTSPTIVFDLDGTLIDSSTLIVNGFNHALMPFGIAVSTEEVEAMRSLTSNELFRDLLAESEAQEALRRLWEYSKNAAADTVLFPGVIDLLNVISNKNITIGLWTGRDRASAIQVLNTHNMAKYFKAIVGGCEVKKNKPNPEGLIMLAERLDVPLTSMIHIGDHDHDLLGANSAGVMAIHAKWCLSATSNQHGNLAHLSFDNIHTLSAWLAENI